jgi:hypothetical protein
VLGGPFITCEQHGGWRLLGQVPVAEQAELPTRPRLTARQTNLLERRGCFVSGAQSR